ncbi:hypothetical protein BKA80DRAFT_280103 [Phyllosticta citrichinensis]
MSPPPAVFWATSALLVLSFVAVAFACDAPWNVPWPRKWAVCPAVFAPSNFFWRLRIYLTPLVSWIMWWTPI